MNIIFKPLTKQYFPLLLKWLNEPHVNKWWDNGTGWTIEKITKKYGSRINSNDIKSYIINLDKNAIGFIQIYDAYKFPRSKPLTDLPQNLAAIDVFIGEEEYLGKGIGAEALKLFIERYSEFEYIFVDPDIDNIAAIKTYQKCGFKEIARHEDTNEIWMCMSLIPKRLCEEQSDEAIQKNII